MDPDIASRIGVIHGDRTHGASWLSKEAIGVIRLAIERSRAKSVPEFLDELTSVAAELTKARPSMVSIANRASRYISEVVERSRTERDTESLKDFARSRSGELADDCQRAALKAAERAAEIVKSGDRAMTCSYSSTVCQTFRTARQQGKDFYVIAARSESHGQTTAAELKSYGVPVEVIPDSDIDSYMPTVDKVLVGADSILGDGSVINGTPTYRIAQSSRNRGIPFYCVCETAKFSTETFPDIELEKGFESIPLDMVTGVITEVGIILKDEVVGQINNLRSSRGNYSNGK